MLTFKLISNKNGILQYEYKPEGDKEAGIISYNIYTKEFDLLKKSSFDEFTSYACHMISKIEIMAEKNIFDGEGIVCWC